MSALTLDPRPYSTAAKVAIKANLGPNDAYGYGQVPGDKNNPDETERKKPLPNIFVLVSIEQTSSANLTMSAKAGTTGWRLAVQAVGRTEDEASWALFKVAEALNEARLSVSGRFTTQLQLESRRAPAPDDGRFSGTSVYTFNH